MHILAGTFVAPSECKSGTEIRHTHQFYQTILVHYLDYFPECFKLLRPGIW